MRGVSCEPICTQNSHSDCSTLPTAFVWRQQCFECAVWDKKCESNDSIVSSSPLCTHTRTLHSICRLLRLSQLLSVVGLLCEWTQTRAQFRNTTDCNDIKYQRCVRSVWIHENCIFKIHFSGRRVPRRFYYLWKFHFIRHRPRDPSANNFAKRSAECVKIKCMFRNTSNPNWISAATTTAKQKWMEVYCTAKVTQYVSLAHYPFVRGSLQIYYFKSIFPHFELWTSNPRVN